MNIIICNISSAKQIIKWYRNAWLKTHELKLIIQMKIKKWKIYNVQNIIYILKLHKKQNFFYFIPINQNK